MSFRPSSLRSVFLSKIMLKWHSAYILREFFDNYQFPNIDIVFKWFALEPSIAK